MKCRDIRDMADSFLNDELLTETNHEILQHLDTCASCRAEIDARRQLRGSLQAAFNRAADLQPSPDFAPRLRDRMHAAASGAKRDAPVSRRWLMLAASAVLTAGLTGAVWLTQVAPVDALARDAIGDHWNCALKHRKVRAPVPLEEAAQRFDGAYRALLKAPANEIRTSKGVARVTDRHSCAFGTRRFGHVVLEYHQHVVSLLVTADDEPAGGAALRGDLDPHLHGRPLNGFSVTSVRGARHQVLLVSDLDGSELRQLSIAVSAPLIDQLAAAR